MPPSLEAGEQKILDSIRARHGVLNASYNQLQKRDGEIQAGLEKAEKDGGHAQEAIAELRKHLIMHRKTLTAQRNELQELEKALARADLAREEIPLLQRRLALVETHEKLLQTAFKQIAEQQEKAWVRMNAGEMTDFRRDLNGALTDLGFIQRGNQLLPQIPARAGMDDEAWQKAMDDWQKSLGERMEKFRKSTFLGDPDWQPGASGPDRKKMAADQLANATALAHPEAIAKVGAMDWNMAMEFRVNAVHLERLQVLQKRQDLTVREAREFQALRRMEMVLAQNMMLQALIGNFLAIADQYGALVEAGEIPEQHRNAYLEQRSRQMVNFVTDAVPRYQRLQQMHHYGNQLVFLQWQVKNCEDELAENRKTLAAMPAAPDANRKNLEARCQILEKERDEYRKGWEANYLLFQQLCTNTPEVLRRALSVTTADGIVRTYDAITAVLPARPDGAAPGSEAMGKWIEGMLKGALQPVRSQMNTMETDIRGMFTQTVDVQLTLSNGTPMHLAPHISHAMLIRSLQSHSAALGTQIAKGTKEEIAQQEAAKKGGEKGAKEQEARQKNLIGQFGQLINTDRRVAGYLTQYATETLPLQRQLMILYATHGSLLPGASGEAQAKEQGDKRLRVNPGDYADQTGNDANFNLMAAQLGFNTMFGHQQNTIEQYMKILETEISCMHTGGWLDQIMDPIVAKVEEMANQLDNFVTCFPHAANYYLHGDWIPGAPLQGLRESITGNSVRDHVTLSELRTRLRASQKTLADIRARYRKEMEVVRKDITTGINELSKAANDLNQAAFDAEASAFDVEATDKALKSAQQENQKNSTDATRKALASAQEAHNKATKTFGARVQAREKAVASCTKIAQTFPARYERLAELQRELSEELTKTLASLGAGWRLWRSSQDVNWLGEWGVLGGTVAGYGLLAAGAVDAVLQRFGAQSGSFSNLTWGWRLWHPFRLPFRGIDAALRLYGAPGGLGTFRNPSGLSMRMVTPGVLVPGADTIRPPAAGQMLANAPRAGLLGRIGAGGMRLAPPILLAAGCAYLDYLNYEAAQKYEEDLVKFQVDKLLACGFTRESSTSMEFRKDGIQLNLNRHRLTAESDAAAVHGVTMGITNGLLIAAFAATAAPASITAAIALPVSVYVYLGVSIYNHRAARESCRALIGNPNLDPALFAFIDAATFTMTREHYEKMDKANPGQRHVIATEHELDLIDTSWVFMENCDQETRERIMFSIFLRNIRLTNPRQFQEMIGGPANAENLQRLWRDFREVVLPYALASLFATRDDFGEHRNMLGMAASPERGLRLGEMLTLNRRVTRIPNLTYSAQELHSSFTLAGGFYLGHLRESRYLGQNEVVAKLATECAPITKQLEELDKSIEEIEKKGGPNAKKHIAEVRKKMEEVRKKAETQLSRLTDAQLQLDLLGEQNVFGRRLCDIRTDLLGTPTPESGIRRTRAQQALAALYAQGGPMHTSNHGRTRWATINAMGPGNFWRVPPGIPGYPYDNDMFGRSFLQLGAAGLGERAEIGPRIALALLCQQLNRPLIDHNTHIDTQRQLMTEYTVELAERRGYGTQVLSNVAPSPGATNPPIPLLSNNPANFYSINHSFEQEFQFHGNPQNWTQPFLEAARGVPLTDVQSLLLSAAPLDRDAYQPLPGVTVNYYNTQSAPQPGRSFATLADYAANRPQSVLMGDKAFKEVQAKAANAQSHVGGLISLYPNTRSAAFTELSLGEGVTVVLCTQVIAPPNAAPGEEWIHQTSYIPGQAGIPAVHGGGNVYRASTFAKDSRIQSLLAASRDWNRELRRQFEGKRKVEEARKTTGALSFVPETGTYYGNMVDSQNMRWAVEVRGQRGSVSLYMVPQQGTRFGTTTSIAGLRKSQGAERARWLDALCLPHTNSIQFIDFLIYDDIPQFSHVANQELRDAIIKPLSAEYARLTSNEQRAGFLRLCLETLINRPAQIRNAADVQALLKALEVPPVR